MRISSAPTMNVYLLLLAFMIGALISIQAGTARELAPARLRAAAVRRAAGCGVGLSEGPNEAR